MADLDEEFALFQAELASLEESKDADKKEEEITSNKRAREDDPTDQNSNQEPPKKAKPTVSSAPVVIIAKPQIYTAPPRPIPTRRDDANSAGISSPSSDPTGYSSSSTGGALSGFPVGTTGEYAATSGEAAYLRRAQLPVHRVDMTTGGLMSSEESHLMNMQQSVYEYDPNKPVRPAQATGAGSGVKAKKSLRMAGGEVWADETLADWPENDFRLFVGDLGNEVNDEILVHAFSRYASFQRARVVRDKYSHKTKGYGFVSFGDPFDCAKALREMNGKYIGNRPVKITKSKWQDRNIDVARKKAKKKSKHHF